MVGPGPWVEPQLTASHDHRWRGADSVREQRRPHQCRLRWHRPLGARVARWWDRPARANE